MLSYSQEGCEPQVSDSHRHGDDQGRQQWSWPSTITPSSSCPAPSSNCPATQAAPRSSCPARPQPGPRQSDPAAREPVALPHSKGCHLEDNCKVHGQQVFQFVGCRPPRSARWCARRRCLLPWVRTRLLYALTLTSLTESMAASGFCATRRQPSKTKTAPSEC